MSAPPTAFWSELAPGVRVRQSAAYRMNSVVVECDGGALLVDPGLFPAELDDLARVAHGAGEVSLVFTHSHWDHVVGRLRWPDAPLVAHRRFHEELTRSLGEVRTCLQQLGDEFYVRWPGEVQAWAPDVRVGEEHTWTWRGRRFVARHAPGHAPDQISLHLPGDRVLVAGDMLSDLEIPILDGACGEYLDSLARIEALGRQGEVETVVPGHGAVAHGWAAAAERLARDRAYLEELHRRVVAARSHRRPLPELVEACAGMDYHNKDGWPPMREVHRRNVERAHRALVGGVA